MLEYTMIYHNMLDSHVRVYGDISQHGSHR